MRPSEPSIPRTRITDRESATQQHKHSTRRDYNRRHYQEHREERLAAQRDYYWAHREERRAYNHNYNAQQSAARRRAFRRRCCLYCGELLTPTARPSMRFYCSPQCGKRGYSEGLRPKPGNQAERLCEACGLVFYSCYPNTRYCSTRCNQRDPHRAPERAERMRDYRRERPDIFAATEERRQPRHVRPAPAPRKASSATREVQRIIATYLATIRRGGVPV
jgi:hypothetical protein